MSRNPPRADQGRRWWLATGFVLLALSTVGRLAVAQELPLDAATLVDEATRSLDAWELEIAAQEVATRAAAAEHPGTTAAVEAQRAELRAYVEKTRALVDEQAGQLRAERAELKRRFEQVIAAWPDLPVEPLSPPPPLGLTPGGGATTPASVVEVPLELPRHEAGQSHPSVKEGAVAETSTTPRPLGEPLARTDAPGLFRRILTKPGASLRARPDPAAAPETRLQPFSVLYVYADEERDGQRWLQVGRRIRDGAEGWLAAAEVEDWKHMLVMTYAPRGQRQRTLFFGREADLVDLVTSYDGPKHARTLYDDAAAGRHDADTLVAIEPETFVDASIRPYLMPILDWRQEEFDLGIETTLVQVAGLNLEQKPPSRPDAAAPAGPSIGVAFVVDTTQSMGPYLEEVKRFIGRFYASARKSALGGRTRFALVGYRDNTAVDPRGEYVTRTFQDFDPGLDEGRLLDNIFSVVAAGVSNKDWREDSFAGLVTAIDELSWEHVDARFIILVTDASARSGSDPLARHRDVDVQTLIGKAQQRDIAILVTHMRTQGAYRSKDVERGERQYAELGRTGVQSANKYVGYDGSTVRAFAAHLGRASEVLLGSVAAWASGREVAAKPLDDAVLAGRGSVVDETGPDDAIANLLATEIFRSQQEYLGRREGTQAPPFYRAWAADRDLTDPRLPTLDVAVFLTRNDLNDLAERLERLVASAENKEVGAGGLFDNLSKLAMRAQLDPRMGDALPSYLKTLPYKSKILLIDRESWLRLGQTGQLELLNEIKAKIRLYREINHDRSKWIDLGAGDPGAQVFPLDLEYLP